MENKQVVRPEDFSSDLINQFIKARKESGMTQLSLDHIIGLTAGQVAKWETRKRRPTLWNAYCWAQALNCNIVLEIKKNDD